MTSQHFNRSISILYSPRVEAIVDSYLDLVNQLRPLGWHIVAPLAAINDDRNIKAQLTEPDWYGWKRKPFKLVAMVKFLFRLRSYILQYNIKNALIFGAPSPWYWLTRLILPPLHWSIYIHDPSPHSGEAFKRKLFAKIDAQFNLLNANQLIASYAAARPILQERLGKRCPPIRIAQLPYISGFNLDNRPDVIYDLIFFGRLEAYKGLDYLEQALKHLELYRQGIKIAIIGRGPMLPHAQRITQVYPGSLLETAFLSKQQLATHIIQSKVVLLPYRDATGTCVIQIANYLGRAVVCTDVGCFPEYVNSGINGYLASRDNPAEYAKQIEKILSTSTSEWEIPCIQHAQQYASISSFAAKIDEIANKKLIT